MFETSHSTVKYDELPEGENCVWRTSWLFIEGNLFLVIEGKSLVIELLNFFVLRKLTKLEEIFLVE